MDHKRVCVVSGGSKGLGEGIVNSLLCEKNIVATYSRKKTAFIENCIKKYPDSFLWEEIDATNFDILNQFTKFIVSRYDKIDILINNAGIGVSGILTLTSDIDIQKAISLNLESVIYLTRACLKSMLKDRKGCIINISSITGTSGFSGMSIYSATKAALDGFTRSLAREVGGEGIRVNSVAPGYFESDMSNKLTKVQSEQIIRRTPLKRLGNVSDIVGIVRFLISEDASFITGQTFVVDGGLTC
ncbi:MAG: SDR family oxidoreductase [Desulfobacterales bacterium]|nr:SDR family oxidoreductase [Desulfobacterales bacterium]MBF0397285.1 SDR family oxidoreductase [Desulfobacterales bacterium]